MCRHGAARLFEPNDRLVRARPQQMRLRDLAIPNAELRITGAEPYGLLHERDRLLYRPGFKLALAEREYCEHPVAIEREHCLIFGNGLLMSALCAQHLAFGEMRKGAAG